jgi:elongation factor P--(R)-beta-lysine ligase
MITTTRLSEPPGKKLLERHRLLQVVRGFFDSRGYAEVETPTVVPSPGLDVHLDAFEVGPMRGAPRFLSTSPEYQMKRLLASGMDRIFQICRAYRRDEQGTRHNPEFTMLEFYRRGDVNGIMRDTEQLVSAMTGGCVTLPQPVTQGRTARVIDVRPPFVRMTVREAFARYADVDEATMLHLAQRDETRFFELLAFTIEPALADLPHAVFLQEYPIEMASLAKPCSHDARYAERFELYVAGIELCNGFGELTDAKIQRERLQHDQAQRKALGKPVYPIDVKFLAALETDAGETGAGLPTCAGNAIGLDRVLALACGLTDIGPLLAFNADEL